MMQGSGPCPFFPFLHLELSFCDFVEVDHLSRASSRVESESPVSFVLCFKPIQGKFFFMVRSLQSRFAYYFLHTIKHNGQRNRRKKDEGPGVYNFEQQNSYQLWQKGLVYDRRSVAAGT
jgi:hypothetical protein